MWSSVVHDAAVAGLDRSRTDGRLAHAYLFTGPPHVGKARLALDLAKAVNCLGPDPPCGQCRACRLIETGQHPDVEIVAVGGLCDQSDHDHRRDNSKDIKICQIRRIARTFALRPFEGRDRIALIDPADALNTYAADALLKTLEEPPDHVALYLIAADGSALPETVLSRCRRVALGPVSAATIQAELVRRGIDLERAELLARLSAGRIGWAIGHASDDSLLQVREERLQRIESLVIAGRAERMAFAAELAARFSTTRDDVMSYLDLWQGWWRDLLLIGEGCEDLIANADRLTTLQGLAAIIAPTGIIQALEAIRACRRQLEDNANARLALEVLVLRLPSPVAYEEAGPEWAANRR
jgi:DNA polymerase-3 subunit delta'